MDISDAFCMRCGGRLARRVINPDVRARLVCISCAHVHYENPRVVVACAAFWKKQILMCRRAHEPNRGCWTLPSGFLECGETVEEGALREFHEETGVRFDAAHLQFHSIISLPTIDQIIIVLRGDLREHPLVIPGAECLDVQLMSEHEVLSTDLAWRDTTRELVRKLFRPHESVERASML